MATTVAPNSTLSTIASLGSNITSTILPIATIHAKYSEAIDIIPVAEKVIMGSLLLVSVASGIFGNILVLFAILYDKMLRDQISNLMILNLAVTDLLISVLPMPVLGAYFIFDWPGWKLGDVMCKVTAYIANVCGLVSLLTMVLIAIDRFFAVVRNKLMLKRRNVKIVLCLFWVLSVSILLQPVISGGLKKGHFEHGEWYVCNRISGKVIVDKSFKNSLMLKLSLGQLIIVSLILIYARIGYFIWRKPKMVRMTDNIKNSALKLMFSIVVTFLICWLPYTIATVLRIFPIPAVNYNIDPTFVLMTYSLAMLNSSINPVLYALLCRKFRTAYRNVLERARSRLSTFRSTDFTSSGRSSGLKKTANVEIRMT